MPFLLLLITTPTLAFEGQGSSPPPTDGEHPALSVGAPVAPREGRWAVAARPGAAGSPLQRTETDGDDIVTTCTLCTVVGLDLSGQLGLTRQLAIGVVVPTYPWVAGDTASGPALGDISLWAPVSLVRSERAGLVLRPFLSLPTGPQARFLGDRTVGGGLMATAGLTVGPWSATAELGADLAGRDVTGPALLHNGLGAYLAVSKPFTLGAELRGQVPLAAPQPVAGPQEVLGVASLALRDGLVLRAGGGAGLFDAPGAASWRAQTALSWSPVPPEAPAPVRLSEQVLYRLTDPDGHALRDAEIVLGGEVIGHTDFRGEVGLARRLSWSEQPLVRARGFELFPVPSPTERDEELEVEVPWTPLPVFVRVVDAAGQLVDADIGFDGERPVPAPLRDGVGTYEYSVSDGIYTLRTSAPGFSPQERTIVVEGGRTEPIHIDAVLTRASDGQSTVVLTITDPDGDPIEGALVQLGDELYGTTGSGGDLTVSQLEEGSVDLQVSHPRYAPEDATTLTLRPDAPARPVVMLTHLPGSVEVRVSGPDGNPTSATVEVRGQTTALRPVETGNDGRHLWVLGEGDWEVRVSSGALGSQRRTFSVDHSRRSLQVIDVLMLPDVGTGSLTVRAIDANGVPIPGAEVWVGDQAVGRTSSWGEVWLTGLAPGDTTLRITAPRVRDYVVPLRLTSEGKEVDALMEWLPGTVQVRALGPDGAPVSGEVRATDGVTTVRGQLDLDGRWLDQLPPGDWEVLVSVAELGLQSRSVVVEPDKTTLLTVDYRLAEVAGDASLSLTLVRPDGEPVEGASVSIDGRPFGTTGTGGQLEVGSLARGAREIVATAPGHVATELVVQLTGGSTEETVTMPWAEGLVSFLVVAGEQPVTDAVLRLAGPSVLSPVGTDVDGRAEVALTPGEWTLLVSSVAAGLHQQEVVVPPGTELTELVVTLERIGTASLLVRVRDEDGKPIAGAVVRLADGTEGVTSSGGATLLSSLLPGDTQLAVDVPDPLLDRSLPYEVRDASDQMLVEVLWPRTDVRFRTYDDRQVPLQAELLLQGPAVMPVLATDTEGDALLELRPGDWKAYGRNGELEATTDFAVEVGEPVQVAMTLAPSSLVSEGGTFRFDESVLFDLGSSALKPAALPAVDQLAARINDDPGIVLAEVHGHTDDTGTLALNMRLSEARAQTVLEALVQRGVARERLRARGFGALRPVANDTDPASRQANRRVEVVVTDRAVR
jgi:outer membrane protein OmpA-like peptidoglycan-associated protein